MSRKLLFSGVIFVLLAAVIATPISVRAEGDPPSTPEPVRPPWITGKNSQNSLVSYEAEDLSITGSAQQGQGIVVPLMAPPSYLDLEPQKAGDPSPDGIRLAVPQKYQDPGDITCGAASLSMALEFLSLSGEGDAPSQETLIGDLQKVGLLYEEGTGVEELAYLARQHGYLGSSAFHDWTLERLAGELAAGHPVVVSLGLNGGDQSGHFVTLTGIAEDGSWVRYNDPILGEQTLSASEFLASWSAQGNSGLSVVKEALAAASDPMLPWMGLFSAITMLAVVAKYYPLGEELSGALKDIRGVLTDPTRKGFGGKIDPGGAGGSSSPPYKAPDGYKWIQKSVPKYGWKYITTTHSRQVPIFEKKKVQVDTQVWYEKVPRYRTVRVDRGRWVNKKVTLYRRKKYVRYYKTTRVRKTRWVRRGWRFVKQTYYVTKKTPVYGYKNVPYRTYYQKEWKSNWVTEKVFDGYTKVRHEKPIYEYLMMPTGKTKTEYYPKTERCYAQIGTELEWQLKKESLSNQEKKVTAKIPPGYTEGQWNSLPYNLQNQILNANEAAEDMPDELEVDQENPVDSTDNSMVSNDPGSHEDISMSQDGLSTLIYEEGGYISTPYNDNNDPAKANCTIGYGHLLHEGPCTGTHPNEVLWMKMDEQQRKKELDALFYDKDVQGIEDGLRGKLDQDVLNGLPQEQFDALISFGYNLGPNSMWVEKVVDHLNSGDIEKALGQMLRCDQVYDSEKGKMVPLEALTRRRLEEAVLFLTGDYGPYLEDYNYASYSNDALTNLYEEALENYKNDLREEN